MLASIFKTSRRPAALRRLQSEIIAQATLNLLMEVSEAERASPIAYEKSCIYFTQAMIIKLH